VAAVFDHDGRTRIAAQIRQRTGNDMGLGGGGFEVHKVSLRQASTRFFEKKRGKKLLLL
jgi:hypothetical protein